VAPPRIVPLPDWPPADFLVASDPLLRDIDGLVYMLLAHRERVAVKSDPKRVAAARDVVSHMLHALRGTKPGALFGQETIVVVLENANDEGFASRLGPQWTIEQRVSIAEDVLRVRLPGVTVPAAVLKRAIELWPTRQKAQRTAALHALAKAMDCDVRNITQALRTAKSRWRAENLGRARARRTKEFPPKT
jgi:hypothetical protein